ncbi:MAG: alpha-amylase family glycosyl hydrolase [Buchananella hordeovulneris]|nr:alpha-amylase family glycosyl hydrolase [Buchananella hordeovulneris]
MKSWVETTCFWHVYPLGMAGVLHGPRDDFPDPGGLDIVSSWLDHAKGIGFRGLQLGPIFASSSHGYDTVDHMRIDPRLGDDASFERLVGALRFRNMRLLLDGVFNHVGSNHPWVEDVRAKGRDSEFYSYFHVTWNVSTGEGPYFHDFEGHPNLVTLNLRNPQVQDYVVDVMCHWLERGADGWRLDAAYCLDPAPLAQIARRVQEIHPEAFIYGEMIHGDYAQFVARSGIDSVTQYELWKSIRSSLRDRNLFELDWNLRRHNSLLDRFVPVTFVGNHDVTRIASALPDPRDAAIATAILMSVGGVPLVYYGDEYGLPGVKEDRPGGDDAVRPAFPPPWDFHPRPEQDAAAGLHYHLLRWRSERPWVTTARTEFLELTNQSAVVAIRAAQSGDDVPAGPPQEARLALNLSDEIVELPVPGALAVDAGTHCQVVGGGSLARVRMAPHGWALLSVQS